MYIRIAVIIACAMLCCPASQADAAHEASKADTALRVLLADEWASRLQDDPLYATQEGVRDYDDRLPPVARRTTSGATTSNHDYARRLAAIDRGDSECGQSGQLRRV